jgi:glycosyltransferase involved in cell wall biosynthesis
MLEFQWTHVASYSPNLKDLLEVIVVDDASTRSPARDVARAAHLPPHSIYRILHDLRWNQDAARNIGAHEARGEWLLLTDIDHVVPEETLRSLAGITKNEEAFYTFARKKFDDQSPRESHPNSYFMARSLYWKIGGHDEDFAGIYGKDFLFRKRANRIAQEVHLEDLHLARVGRVTIPDAGTETISRDNTLVQRIWGYLLEFLKFFRLWRGVQTLTCDYIKVV